MIIEQTAQAAAAKFSADFGIGNEPRHENRTSYREPGNPQPSTVYLVETGLGNWGYDMVMVALASLGAVWRSEGYDNGIRTRLTLGPDIVIRVWTPGEDGSGPVSIALFFEQ